MNHLKTSHVLRPHGSLIFIVTLLLLLSALLCRSANSAPLTDAKAPGADEQAGRAVGLSSALSGAGEGQPAALDTLTTTATVSGQAGAGGWYLSPVTVTLEAVSGGETIVATHYRLDGSTWSVYSEPVLIAADGHHTLEYYSTGAAGTVEPVRTCSVAKDAMPPSSSAGLLPAYQTPVTVTVSWSGSDNGGSGVTTFDVQYRSGIDGVWTPWLTATTNVSATLAQAERGRVFYVRTRARDLAGNVESYPPGNGDAYTFIDALSNGGFETGSFSNWSVTGALSSSVVLAPSVGGSGQYAALLGSPAYGDSITPTALLHVPTDTFASLAQVIQVPPLSELPSPSLSLWHRMLTYDVVWGCSYPDRLYDSLDVNVRDVSGNLLATALRAGNYDCDSYLAYVETHGEIPPLTEISMQRAVDLSPWAGQRIMLEIRNSNRFDWFNNTWTYLDGLRVINQPVYVYKVSLPSIVLNYPGTGLRSQRRELPPLNGGSPPRR